MELEHAPSLFSSEDKGLSKLSIPTYADTLILEAIIVTILLFLGLQILNKNPFCMLWNIEKSCQVDVLKLRPYSINLEMLTLKVFECAFFVTL